MPRPFPAQPVTLKRLCPGLWQLQHYQRDWWRGDALAGVTVAAYLVPQTMAYAQVAGLPAVTGLWAMVSALVVYAVVGSSRQLSVGPESSTALMTAAAAGTLAAGRPEQYPAAAALLAVAVGLVCVVGWVARLGFLANLLSRPVLVGYMSGIAVLMIASQLGKLTGLPTHGASALAELGSVLTQLGSASWPTVAVSLGVLGLLAGLQHWLPRSPAPLIAMVLAAALVAVLPTAGAITTIGAIPRGLPPVGVPNVVGLELTALVPAALGIALVGYSDNVLTARAFAAARREEVDNTQEFLALGAANLAAGLCHGFPVSSSGTRTALGSAMGSRTQLHSLVAVLTVVIAVVVLNPVLAAFPTAALGAVVVYAAIRLIDLDELRRLARFRRSELVLALTTTASVVVLDVLYAIGVAVVLSILDLLRRIVHAHDAILGLVPGLAGMHDIDDYAAAREVPGLVVYRYDAPLFFANAEDFRRRALAAVDRADPPPEWFLLNVEANVEVDLTAVDALDSLRVELAARGVEFALARVKQDLHAALERAGFLTRVGPERLFLTLPTAVEAYHRWHREQHGHPPAPGTITAT